MRSRDGANTTHVAAKAHLAFELNSIVSSNAFWIAVALVSLIAGYSLVQAASIYANASESATGQMLLLKTVWTDLQKLEIRRTLNNLLSGECRDI